MDAEKKPDSPAAPADAEKVVPAAAEAAPAKTETPAKAEVKAEAAKPEPQPVAKAEAKPEAKPAPAPKAEAKPAPKAEAKPAPKAEAKAAPAAKPVAAKPVVAKPVPAPAAMANTTGAPVKRGRGRPRKSEAEKAATAALRKQNAAKRRAAVAAPVKPAAAVQSKPVIKSERKPTMTIDTTAFFTNLGTLPGAGQFQAALADANAKSREALSKSAKVAEELVELTKANVEAVVSSGRIASAGVQALGQDALAYGKDSVEKASAAVKSFAEAKSPTELLQLQSDFARASFDRMLSNSSKLTESMVKLVGEAIEPLSSRASVNAEKINTFIA